MIGQSWASKYALTGVQARKRWGFLSARTWQDALTSIAPTPREDEPSGHEDGPGAPQSVLSICTVLQDRARFLKEWINYHLLVGVGHFYIYDHGSVDDLAVEVQPFVDKGLVTIHDWKHAQIGHDPQGRARTHCFASHSSSTQFFAMIDVDEFLYSRAAHNIRCVIEAMLCTGTDVLNLRWFQFTSDNHNARPKGLVLENYSKRCPVAHGVHFKYVVKASAVRSARSQRHCFVHKCYAGTGKTQAPDDTVLQLRHYNTLSKEDFLKRESTGIGKVFNKAVTRNTMSEFR
eukprot:g4133.t1